MSSQYAILDNRPIDQWKVTELKEELKRRKLAIKGLKEDLVKRLDEAIRNERESAEENTDNGFAVAAEPELHSDKDTDESFVSGMAKDLKESEDYSAEKVDGETPEIEIGESRGTLDEGKVVEGELNDGSDSASMDKEQVTQVTTVETSVMVERVESVTTCNEQYLHTNETNNGNGDSNVQSDDDDSKSPREDAKLNLSDSNTQVSEVSDSGVSEVPLGELDAKNREIQNETRVSEMQLENDGSKSLHVDVKLNSSDLNYQVSEVNSELGFRVISDSVSTESSSIVEKIELKVDVIAADVKCVEVKPGTVPSSPSNVVTGAGESYPMDVEEPRDNTVPLEEKGGNNAENIDILKKNDSGELGSLEKLNLDRSSNDDSMEEDILESKQMDANSSFDEVRERGEKTELPIAKEEDILESEQMDSKSKFDEMREGGEKTKVLNVKEEDDVDVVGHDITAEPKVSNVENKDGPALTSVKRKSVDQGAVGNNDVARRQRRWNSESLKVLESQSGNIAGSTTPKDPFKPTFRRSFSRSDSTVSGETPKERVVPPLSKPHTNALRIDHFLRPFTLKAVQELLGKAGTITSFWMDHIKTHCYVSYSSVEEAVETRNAVYNLQWPPNGGRLLVAEFVDPQEVKMRVEAPPLSPATPSGSGAPTPTFPPAQPSLQSHQPSPRQQVQRHHLPPPPLPPPPPPLSKLPVARERPQLEREPLPKEHPVPAREPLLREEPLPVRERLNLPPPPPPVEKVDPPILTLDDLFRKTNATPRIYYLPLSDEQVAAKLQAQGNNAKQYGL